MRWWKRNKAHTDALFLEDKTPNMMLLHVSKHKASQTGSRNMIMSSGYFRVLGSEGSRSALEWGSKGVADESAVMMSAWSRMWQRCVEPTSWRTENPVLTAGVLLSVSPVFLIK